MSATTDKEKALLFLFEIERMGKESRLPYMVIVHCPDTGEWVRASDGIKSSREAVLAFAAVSKDYLTKLENLQNEHK